MVSTALALGRAHQRLDQPAAALALYAEAAARQPWEPGLLLAAARVRDALGQGEEALGLYQQVWGGLVGWVGLGEGAFGGVGWGRGRRRWGCASRFGGHLRGGLGAICAPAPKSAHTGPLPS